MKQVLILLLFLVGCTSEPDVEVTLFDSNSPLIEIQSDYEILEREPNLLIVEMWNQTGISHNVDVRVETKYRITVSKPYVIEVCEPNRLVVNNVKIGK